MSLEDPSSLAVAKAASNAIKEARGSGQDTKVVAGQGMAPAAASQPVQSPLEASPVGHQVLGDSQAGVKTAPSRPALSPPAVSLSNPSNGPALNLPVVSPAELPAVSPSLSHFSAFKLFHAFKPSNLSHFLSLLNPSQLRKTAAGRHLRQLRTWLFQRLWSLFRARRKRVGWLIVLCVLGVGFKFLPQWVGRIWYTAKLQNLYQTHKPRNGNPPRRREKREVKMGKNRKNGNTQKVKVQNIYCAFDYLRELRVFAVQQPFLG